MKTIFRSHVLRVHKSKFAQVKICIFSSRVTMFSAHLCISSVVFHLVLFLDTFILTVQFIMFYACSLDPEICGLEFAVFLTDIFTKKEEDAIAR